MHDAVDVQCPIACVEVKHSNAPAVPVSIVMSPFTSSGVCGDAVPSPILAVKRVPDLSPDVPFPMSTTLALSRDNPVSFGGETKRLCADHPMTFPAKVYELPMSQAQEVKISVASKKLKHPPQPPLVDSDATNQDFPPPNVLVMENPTRLLLLPSMLIAEIFGIDPIFTSKRDPLGVGVPTPRVVALATPKIGVTRVGDVSTTNFDPVPV